MVKRRKPKQETGELRIIGGKWKRTRLTFPVLEGVRPTPSRVRETLFNWLTFDINGSHCLDLFSGSGALGLEALSRGAAQAWFVDLSPEICQSLKQHINKLEANASVIQASAIDTSNYAKQVNHKPDIIFCDPPFNKNLVPDVIQGLEKTDWLTQGTQIYIETEARLNDLTTPDSWELLREKKAGDVIYRLYEVYKL